LFARAIHYDGARKDQPFVEINCATIPNHLLESELFGYERGAFTDARKRKLGLVESADGGTVFLDEIGTVEFSIQAKLLKLLEDKTVRRLGSVRDQKVNIRIISATNEDLMEAVEKGKFRSDLFYRLKVVNLELPPLREREDDVILLAEHFLELLSGRYGKPQLKFSAAARDDIRRHPWPGNVRELRNVIEQTVLMTAGDIIEPGFLPRHPVLARAEITEIKDPTTRIVAAFSGGNIRIEDVERGLIARALESSAGNVTKAAGALGMSRDALRYRMEKYNLRPPI
jgi:transcriptional regulator with PAS, ATPase and Fis domain